MKDGKEERTVDPRGLYTWVKARLEALSLRLVKARVARNANANTSAACSST
jgi:hypothetical protein